MPGKMEAPARSVGTVTIRNEPVQARSTARLSGLLDAAAAVIDEIGYERLTTAMVAERSNASIGTVYRYFPDRIVVLQALAERNLERLTERVRQEVGRSEHETWRDAVLGVVDAYLDFFRNEPGFSSLRIGDVLDLRPVQKDSRASSRLAQTLAEALGERFSLPDSAALALESAIVIVDALLDRAFHGDDRGDERFVRQAREAASRVVGEQVAQSVS